MQKLNVPVVMIGIIYIYIIYSIYHIVVEVEVVEVVRVLWLFWGNLSKLTAYFKCISTKSPKKTGLRRLGATPPNPPTSLLWKHVCMLVLYVAITHYSDSLHFHSLTRS